MNYGDWEKEYKRAKKVAETKVKSAQPTTRFYRTYADTLYVVCTQLRSYPA